MCHIVLGKGTQRTSGSIVTTYHVHFQVQQQQHQQAMHSSESLTSNLQTASAQTQSDSHDEQVCIDIINYYYLCKLQTDGHQGGDARPKKAKKKLVLEVLKVVIDANRLPVSLVIYIWGSDISYSLSFSVS